MEKKPRIPIRPHVELKQHRDYKSLCIILPGSVEGAAGTRHRSNSQGRAYTSIKAFQITNVGLIS